MKNSISFFLIILLFLEFSCASVPHYTENDLATITNLKTIEGEYENLPFNHEQRNYKTFDKAINWREKQNDNMRFSSVRVNVENDNLLKFTFVDNLTGNKVVYAKCKINQNGLVDLKNKNFRLTGLPYIFGGYQLNKIQVGFTKNSELVLTGVMVDEGAILVVFPASVPKSNYTYKFKKI